MNYIQSGVAEGAGILMGGDSDIPGYFIDPAIFENITPEDFYMPKIALMINPYAQNKIVSFSLYFPKA